MTGRDLGDEDHDRAGVSLGQGDPPVVQGEVVVLGPRPEVPGWGEGVDCGLVVDPPLAGPPGAVEGDDRDDLDDGGAQAVQAPAGGGGVQGDLEQVSPEAEGVIDCGPVHRGHVDVVIGCVQVHSQLKKGCEQAKKDPGTETENEKGEGEDYIEGK